MTRRTRFAFHARLTAVGVALGTTLSTAALAAGDFPITAQQRSTAQQVAQAGVALSELAPGFEPPPSWTGLFGPPGLQPAVLRRVGNDSARALHQPAVKAKMAEAGFEVRHRAPSAGRAHGRCAT